MYLTLTLTNIQKTSIFPQFVFSKDLSMMIIPIKKCFKYISYTIQSENYSVFITELANDFLHRVIAIYLSHECCPKIIPEVEIVFYIRIRSHNSTTLSRTTKLNALS